MGEPNTGCFAYKPDAFGHYGCAVLIGCGCDGCKFFKTPDRLDEEKPRPT